MKLYLYHQTTNQAYTSLYAYLIIKIDGIGYFIYKSK